MNGMEKKEAEKIDKIIVGLGNPGPDYAGTRHNLGWRALDEFIRLLGIKKDFQPGSKFRSQAVEVDGHKILLVRPTTYMNLSGEALRPLLDKHRLEISDVLVVHDDMDIESGRAKMRYGGGAAGHKGIKSIIDTCGSDFTRLKIGIGAPPYDADSDIDWVLGQPTDEEERILTDLMPDIAEGMRAWVIEGPEKAMTWFNTRMNPDLEEKKADDSTDNGGTPEVSTDKNEK